MTTEQIPDAPTADPVDDGKTPVVVDAPAAKAPSVEAPAPTAVDEAPSAPVAEAPPVEPAPVAPPDQAPAVPSAREVELGQQLAAVQQREAAQQQASQQAAIQQAARQQAAQKANQLVQQGTFLPEQAQQLTEYFLPYEQQALQLQQGAQAYAQHLTDKTNYAAKMAALFGVSHTELMDFETPQAMERHAQGQARLRAAEEKVAKLTKAQVAAQTFSPGVTGASTGELEGAELETAVGNGTVEFTPAVAERLIKYQQSQGFNRR